MHARSFALLSALTASLALAAGCGPALDKLLGKESPTPSPVTSGVTPTPSGSTSPTPTPAVTTTGELTTVDWGTVALPAGQSPTFSFTAPAGTIGVEFLAIGSAADASDIFIFFGVTSPAGTVINSSANGPEQQSGNTGLAAFGLPSSDKATAAVSAGNYTFHVAAFSAATGNPPIASNTHVMAKYRVRAGGLANTNILDLNIVIVQGARIGLTATTAASDTEVQTALNRMASNYASAGLQLGTITYYDLANPSFATISTEAQLSQLFLTSASVTGNALTIYLINGFSTPDFANGVAGVAGGIPSPNGLNGTLHSGAAIALQGVASADSTGDDMSHEIGHTLGLYHTTESDGATYDPISDTLQCSAAQNQANPSACPDAGNIMFWQLVGAASPAFTAGQGNVVRAAINMHSGASFAPETSWVPPPENAVPLAARPSGFVLQCATRHKPFVATAPLTILE